MRRVLIGGVVLWGLFSGLIVSGLLAGRLLPDGGVVTYASLVARNRDIFLMDVDSGHTLNLTRDR
jgi:hypothetical protein